MDCNRCGECCRIGGACMLRGESWSLKKIPYEFEGACELLTPEGECSVMQAIIKQDGSDENLRHYVALNGKCNFPDLRLVD